MKYEVKDLVNFSDKEFKEKVKNCKELVLYVRNFGELMMVTEHIPSSVTELRIISTDGYLPLGGEENLNDFFLALPETVTRLKFPSWSIGRFGYNIASQRALLKVMPDHITEFTLGKELFFNSLKSKEFKIYELDSSEYKVKQDKNDYLNELSLSEKQIKNKGLESVIDHMLKFKKKIRDMDTDGLLYGTEYYQAEAAAKNVFDSITDIIKLYAKGTINEVQFKVRATYILSEGSKPQDLYKSFINHQYFAGDQNKKIELRQEIDLLKNQNANYQLLKKDVGLLNTHRGDKEILINLLAACLVLVVPYLIAAAIKRNWTLFKVPTDSGEKVHNLLNEINRVECKMQ